MNRLHENRRLQLLNLLIEGVGVRSACRICGISKAATQRFRREMGEWARDFHDARVRGVRPSQVQCDESWTLIKGREFNRAHDWDESCGNTWVWTALERDSRLLISWLAAKRTFDSAVIFMTDLEERCVGDFQIVSDGAMAYPHAIDVVFYQRKIEHLIVGNKAHDGDVTTNHVERHNGAMRQAVSAMRRDAKTYAKTLRGLNDALALYMIYYNFCKVHVAHGVTPAMAAGLATEPLTLRDLLACKRHEPPASLVEIKAA